MEAKPLDDYKELLYIRRRFFSVDGLWQAIASVANATLGIRLPQIWGETTTVCASDSKQFGAWDENLLTEWHVRYGGRVSLAIHMFVRHFSFSKVIALGN